MRSSLTLAVALVLFSFAMPARRVAAQDADPSHVAAARALFQEGVALARRGEYESAVDRFRRAHALRSSPPIALNLATALVHTGRMVEASEIFERLLRDPTLARDLRATVTRERNELAPRLARLTVRLEGDPRGVAVEIDRRALPDAAIGVAIPIDPGAHEVVATRESAAVASERIELAEGASSELLLSIPPMAEVVAAGGLDVGVGDHAATDDARSAASSGSDDAVWIGVGIGVALAVGAAAAVTAVVLTTPASPMPVGGTTMPGVLTW
jgi:hypothetical protein